VVFSFVASGYSPYQFIANNYDGWVVTPAYTVSPLESGYQFSLSAQNLLNNPVNTAYDASGNVDFSDTLSLSVLEPYTSAGDYVSDAVIGSIGLGGGFNFATAPSVPEPSTWVIATAGLLLPGCRFRRLSVFTKTLS